MIGGLVFWGEGSGRAAPSALRAMVGRLGNRRATLSVEQGSMGLFASTPNDRLESSRDIWVAADLDLTNTAELETIAGREGRESGLLTALYRLDGVDFVKRLAGGFAVAVWDAEAESLLLAVDRFGIKRLYRAADGHRTAFASRAIVLLGAPGVSGAVNPNVVFEYLNFGYVPAPDSVYTDVQRLEPGQMLVAGKGQPRLTRYWDLSYPERTVSEKTAAASIYTLTQQAVEEAIRGIAPKELGAFLSGGTDSTTLLGLMHRVTGERVNAFSIGFNEPRYDELGYAEIAARQFDATHYTHIVTADETLDLLPRLVEGYDEPFANNSAIGTFACARLARDCGVKRMVAGDGGDEIFGGNERYRTDRIFARYQRVPAVLRHRVLEPVLSHMQNAPWPLGRAHRYVRRANIPNPRRFYSYELFFSRDGYELLHPGFREAISSDAPNRVIETHFFRPDVAEELHRLLYLDMKLTIGDNDLLKVTRTAEFADIAVAFPMLNVPLVDFVNSLPADYKVRGLDKRYLFKQAFRTLLPSAIVAKRKHGFGVPTSVWMRTHARFRGFVEDVLLSTRALQRGYFNTGAIERMLELHRRDTTSYYGDLLWGVLMLELWHRRHADQAREAVA